MAENSPVIYGRPHHSEFYFKYETVPGIFLQDDPTTDAKSFDYSKNNLGLIDRDYPGSLTEHTGTKKTQWQKLEDHITVLNKEAPAGEEYKLLYLGRHGQGEHNVAEAQYGTAKWDCYWSRQEGDGQLYWVDAHLTTTGEGQARTAHEFWQNALAKEKIPAPQSYYVSPLDRCCATANITFSGLDLPADRPFKPLIKELSREVLGVHTCDKRSPKSSISKRWPAFTFEDGFVEEDPLWDPEIRESDSQLDYRMKSVLDDVFTNNRNTYISFSSHSGAIGGYLRVLGHREFRLQTGGVIPVLVKATRVAGSPPPVKIEPGYRPPKCEKDDNPPPKVWN